MQLTNGKHRGSEDQAVQVQTDGPRAVNVKAREQEKVVRAEVPHRKYEIARRSHHTEDATDGEAVAKTTAATLGQAAAQQGARSASKQMEGAAANKHSDHVEDAQYDRQVEPETQEWPLEQHVFATEKVHPRHEIRQVPETATPMCFRLTENRIKPQVRLPSHRTQSLRSGRV